MDDKELYVVYPNQIIRKPKKVALSFVLHDKQKPEDVKSKKEVRRKKKSVYVTKRKLSELNKVDITTVSGEISFATYLRRIYSMLPVARNIESSQHLGEYKQYKIPKKSGGYRIIEEPCEYLKITQDMALRELFLRVMHQPRSSQAYAYAEDRNTKDAMTRHIRNKSRWYLKLDLHDFFGSTTYETIHSQLEKLYPFYYAIKYYDREDKAFERIIKNIFLNKDGVLPQGAASSPALSNIVMIPFDYEFNKWCREHKLVYTRFADDMIISGKDRFNYKEVIEACKETMKQLELPYELNEKKTRYGSFKGKNMHLGLVCNGNYDLTVGHRNKKIFKAMLANLAGKTVWVDVNKISGLYHYYKYIEPDYVDYVIKKYSKKYNLDFDKSLNLGYPVKMK